MASRGRVSSSRQFPASYKVLTVFQKRAWLRGEEAKRLVDAGEIDAKQLAAEARRMEAAADRIRAQGERADRVLNPKLEANTLWPRHYLSRTARVVRSKNDGRRRRLAPESTTYDVVCLDDYRCRQKMDLPAASPSATKLALEELERVGGRITQMKLATEDETALRAQIDRYIAGNAQR
jgi:hypothetical protein